MHGITGVVLDIQSRLRDVEDGYRHARDIYHMEIPPLSDEMVEFKRLTDELGEGVTDAFIAYNRFESACDFSEGENGEWSHTPTADALSWLHDAMMHIESAEGTLDRLESLGDEHLEQEAANAEVLVDD